MKFALLLPGFLNVHDMLPNDRPVAVQGVTKHRRSGRWEAHVWVREAGKQAYLGGYSTEEEAAEAHDVAALKCHGLKAKTNFHISRYPLNLHVFRHSCVVAEA